MRNFLSLIALCFLAACSAPPQKAEHVLTYASPYPPSHPFSRADIAWMEHIEKASGGRIDIRPYWSGSLLSSDMSMVEIRHGVADIGLITPIYTRGGVHLLRAQSGFYGGVQSLDDQVKVYDCLAAQFQQIDREMAGLHVLAVQGGNFPGILTRTKPVRHLSDLKGLRLRAQTEANAIWRELGADPVNMPMGEVYSALAKGVIDGVVAPADTIKSLHFGEVAKHFTAIKFARGAYPARAMSSATFNRLPPDLQKILDDAKPIWEAAMSREILKAEAAGIAMADEAGVEMIAFPVDEQAKFDSLYNQLAVGQAKRRSRFGIDALPVLNEAQRLIQAGPIHCAAPTAGVKR